MLFCTSKYKDFIIEKHEPNGSILSSKQNINSDKTKPL